MFSSAARTRRGGATVVAAVAAAAMVAGSAYAGPEWVEGADAGETPTDAQNTTGVGAVTFIRGKLGGLEALPLGGDADFQDVFVIFIDDPMAFSATTAFNGGQADFDSRLYLFTMDGQGLIGNDTAPSSAAGSTDDALITNMSDDGTGVVIDTPGLYLLAVTVSPFGPQCEGENIFEFEAASEQSGPDGDAAAGCVFGDWGDNPLQVGACCFEFSPCELLTADECDALEGSFLGLGSTCADCPAFGACCIDGSCFETTIGICDKFGGDFFEGSDCKEVSCPEPLGACCLPESATAGGGDPVCVDGVTESECEIELDGVFQGPGTDCFDNLPGGTCFGACIGDICLDTTEASCNQISGTFLGNGTGCATWPAGAGEPIAQGGAAGNQGGVAGTQGEYLIRLSGVTFAQPPEAIPTLSEWGLMLMGLLLVGGITIMIRRV